MAGDLINRKSTSTYLVIFLGAISWKSKLQKCDSLSTIEAEYIATTKSGKDMLWIKRFLKEHG